MLDDLRNGNDDQSSFFQQDDMSEIEPMLEKKPKKSGLGLANLNVKFNSNSFLGMNAFQRFVITTLLFLVVCIMGAMLLVITGKVSLF